jgi:hypothetical protein
MILSCHPIRQRGGWLYARGPFAPGAHPGVNPGLHIAFKPTDHAAFGNSYPLGEQALSLEPPQRCIAQPDSLYYRSLAKDVLHGQSPLSHHALGDDLDRRLQPRYARRGAGAHSVSGREPQTGAERLAVKLPLILN